MRSHQPILTYLLIFLAVSIILKFFGVIEYDGVEILSYAFIFYGISTFYVSFGKNQKGFLFIGSFTFLIGIALFVLSNFSIVHPREIIIPSFLLISGVSMLMIYIEGNSSFIILGVSSVLLITGLILSLLIGTFSLNRFIYAIGEIVLKYWPVLIIVAGIILLIRRDERKNKEP